MNIYTAALLGGIGCVVAAYRYRGPAMRYCAKGVGRLVDQYVDWTWTPRPAEPAVELSVMAPSIVQKHETYIIYRHNGREYLHFGQEVPEVPLYDEDDIDNIVVYTGEGKVEPSAQLRQYIIMSLGPGCSMVPKLDQLRSLDVLREELAPVTKIIVNLQSMSELVVL